MFRTDIFSGRQYANVVKLLEMATTMELGVEEETKNLKSTQARVTNGLRYQKNGWDNHNAGPIQKRYPQCTKSNRRHGRVVGWISRNDFSVAILVISGRTVRKELTTLRSVGREATMLGSA